MKNWKLKSKLNNITHSLGFLKFFLKKSGSEDVEGKTHSCVAGGDVKWYNNSTPRNLPKRYKTYIHTKTCTYMFITT